MHIFRATLKHSSTASPSLFFPTMMGCVVAYSNEAEAFGIKMGVPLFEVKAWSLKI
jgi:hypothetical protein